MRLFVAVWPPDEVVDQLRAIPRPEVPNVRWSTEDQWHVTLRFLGDVAGPDAVRSELADAALPTAMARLGPEVQRFTATIAVVPVAGLDELAATVDHALGASAREFRGHLTVARARGGGRIAPSLVGEPIRATWTVHEIALVRSELAPNGARYETVERFPTG